MIYKLKWEGDDGDKQDACGSVSELAGTVGLFYIFLICLGLLFVTLEKLQSEEMSPSQTHSPQAALYQALLPFDQGH
ncbi:MAG: hypothetical protein ACLPX9_08965 [Rhodomicrobium sp.]